MVPLLVAWDHPLYLDGGGYWPNRVTLTISSSVELAGAPQHLTIGSGANEINLIGAEARSVRVVDEAGRDLLFGLNSASGEPKHSGTLAVGDQLTIPVECPSNETRRVFVYSGNAHAGEVPEFLGGGFANGGFEAGTSQPAAWVKSGADADHVVEWVSEGVRSGKRCVHAVTTAKARRIWFNYMQGEITVIPRQEYELRGWVRAKGVRGSAGWFVHVNGVKPQMVNQVLNAGEGSYDWKEVAFRFTVPKGGATAVVGTVLYGTGEAWFDDCSLNAVGDTQAVSVKIGSVESAGLDELRVQSSWLRKSAVRVPLRFCNFGAAIPKAFLSADIRRASVIARLKPVVRVYNANSGQEVPVLVEGTQITFQDDVPARSVVTYHAYLTESAGPTLRPADLVTGPANLVVNGSFEDGEVTPTSWEAHPFGRRVTGGKTGEHCVELTVPADAQPGWPGWHQTLPVEPGATYLIGGWMKTRDVDGGVNLYAHVLNASRQLVGTNPYLGTAPTLTGTTEWTWVQTLVRLPADARFITLHLTMNAHGTVWHDGIVMKRVADIHPAQALALESPPSRGLDIWQANPTVKIFRDTPPGPGCRNVSVTLARNEREPVQLVLRSDREHKGVSVGVGSLTNARGQTLPAVAVARVGYVPVDVPSNYYGCKVPAWQRKLPNRHPGCDGWPGDWPDPLVPADRVDLEAGLAQPVWLTVHAPAGTTPGEYRGKITIRWGWWMRRVIPLTVTVRDFPLPRRPSLQIIYDLRGVKGEEARQWYRLLAERRCSPGLLPEPKAKLVNGEVQMDFTEFDEAAAYCFDELGMSAMYTPWYFYAFGWAYSPRKFLGLAAFTPEWEKAFGSAYRQYVEHVWSKGWLDRIVFYISDEPHDSHPEVIANLARFAKYVRGIAPEVPVYSSTWRHMPGLDGALTLWGAGHHESFPVERMRARQQAGDNIWFTTDGQQCLDTPYAGTERMLSWYCFKYGTLGFEFWGVNWYTFDPWRFGWHRFISQASSEKEEPHWVRYPNGDGYLAYPGKRVGVVGPVSSIRLEAVRDGEEDYEYLYLLRQRIETARQAGKPVASAEAVLAEALSLVEIPNAGGMRSTECIADPDSVLKIREALAAQIEALW